MNAPPTRDAHGPGAVVVTYFPDADIAARLAAIAREFDAVIVVDNSADAAVQTQLRAACAQAGFHFIGNPENRGLAAALNTGFGLHAAQGRQWAVAFDQDSIPEPGFAAALLKAAAKSPPAAVVGANWRDEAHPDRHSRHVRRHPTLPLGFRREVAEQDLEEVTFVIASGSLYELATWQKLGGFDEELFLDLVDTDYCLRTLRLGRSIRVAAEARLRHRRGRKRAVQLAGRTFFPAFMPPIRLRYVFRNRMRLLWRHARFAPHVLAYESVYAAKILADILLFEDDKLMKLAACERGIWDGMLGRKGPIVPPPA